MTKNSCSSNVATSDRANTVIFLFLVATVALAPLPFGSNRPLPAAFFAAAIGVILIVWYICQIWKGSTPLFPLKLIGAPVLLFSFVCFWIMIQSLTIFPANWIDPIWHLAYVQLSQHVTGAISINPGASTTGLMHLLTYSAVFWLSLQLCHQTSRAKTALRLVAFIGGIYCLYGIIAFLLGNDKILIFDKWVYSKSLTSTFVNRNNFATFAGLCLMASLALWLESLQPIFRQRRPPLQTLVLVLEHLLIHRRWLTATVLTISIGLALTASRGGTASTICAAVLLIFIFLMHQSTGRKSNLRKKVVSLMLMFTLTSLVVVIAGQNLFNRFSQTSFEEGANSRGRIYELTLEGIESTPWKGIGFGSFEDAITAYKRNDMSPLWKWDKAHNTYLENAFELGIPAALALNASIALLGLQCWGGVRVRKRGMYIPAAGAAATLLVGLHSTVDFSLQIPAVSILYAFILGVSVAQSRRSPEKHDLTDVA